MSKDKQDARAAAASANAPASSTPTARFRVWPHGDLIHDGVRFGPGEEVPMAETEVSALIGNVLERIEE